MLWKCCTQYAHKFGKLSSGHRTGKGQFSFQKRQCLESSNYHIIALIPHSSKVMLKILQARLQQYTNHELPDVQAVFRKGRRTRDQITNVHWIIEKAREFKNIFCFIEYTKAFAVWITTNWKILKEMRWEYQTILCASWENCMQNKKQQLELDIEQVTDSGLGKEYLKSVYCHPAYLTYMQSTSGEIPSWMNNKLESRLLGEMSSTSDMQMIPHLWQKVKKN